MKKIIVLIVCLMAIQFSVVASNDKKIEFNQLPQQAQQLVKKYFASQDIALVKMDSELFDKSYEVIFSHGDKIEFDQKGLWKEIDCKYTQVPIELIPAQIKNYVSKSYSDVTILKIEKESRGGYDVELSNHLDLKFDSQFNLVDIDN